MKVMAINGSPRKISTAFVYTMNISEEMMKEYHYPVHTLRR